MGTENALSEVRITSSDAWFEIEFANEEANPLYYAHNLYINGNILRGLVATSLSDYTINYYNEAQGLHSIHIGIKQVKPYAFINATCIRVIEIGDNTLNIGTGAFKGCVFSYAALPAGRVTQIIGENKSELLEVKFLKAQDSGMSSKALANAAKLRKVTFKMGGSGYSIGSNAFDGCTALTGVYIDDISDWAQISFNSERANPLYYAHNLYCQNRLVTTLEITSRISGYAFVNATCLEAVIGGTNLGMGGSAFKGCTQIRIVKTSNVDYLAEILLSSIQNVETIELSACSTLPENALKRAVKLQSIDLGTAMTRIGDGAFSACTSLKTITGSGVTYIGTGALEDTVWYKSFNGGLLSLGHVIVRYTSTNKIDLSNNTAYNTINKNVSVSCIYDRAFSGAKISNLNLTSSIAYGRGAFFGATVDTFTLPAVKMTVSGDDELSGLFDGSGTIETFQFASGISGTLTLNGIGLTVGTIAANAKGFTSVVIKGFTRINKLSLHDNSLEKLDLATINARYISLNGNKITELTYSTNTANTVIEYIYMPSDGTKNRLEKLDFAKNLPNLYSLDVANNNVSSISGILNLQNLAELYLGGNPVLKNSKSQIDSLVNAPFLKKLVRLNLGDSSYGDSVLNVVKKCTNLKWLQIYNIGKSVSEIASAINQSTHASLSYLKISHNGSTAIPANLSYIGTVVIDYEDKRQD